MKACLQLFNYTFSNSKDETVDIYVDGYIVDAPTQEMLKDFWGDETSVSFKSLRNQVLQANPKVVNLIVNSGGGHVGDAMASHDFFDELEQKGVKVNRKGTGIIASAATYLVMGENSEMTENSMWMIHNVHMVAMGDINQVENQVKAGRKFNNMIRDFYANKTGNPPETVASWMNKETWFTAAEAKQFGFVKNVSGKASFKNSIKPEHWPYSNTAVLNTYNSFISNSDNMDIKKITDTISEAVNGAFEKLKNALGVKPEDKDKTNALNEFSKSITDALTASLKGLEGIDQKSIQDMVTKAFTDLKIADLINNQVTEATKGLVKSDDLEKLKTELANKLGAPAKEKEEQETDKDRVVKNKREFFKVGNFAKN